MSIGRLQITSAKIPCNIELNLSVVKPWIAKAEFELSGTATLAREIISNAYNSNFLQAENEAMYIKRVTPAEIK